MWFSYLILTGVMLAAHLVVLKMISTKFDPMAVAATFYAVGLVALLGLALVTGQKFEKSMVMEPKNLALIIAAGVTIGLVDYFVVTAFSKGAPVSVAAPVYMATTIALVALAGVLMFKESLSVLNLVGIGLAGVSIYLVMR